MVRPQEHGLSVIAWVTSALLVILAIATPQEPPPEPHQSPILASEPSPEPSTPERHDPLTEDELVAVLELAGWPGELVPAAMQVASCESHWSPTATNGYSLGLFQIQGAQRGWVGWYGYLGEDEEQWADPVVNARTAWGIVQYSRARGQSDFAQWVCQPWKR